MAPKMAPCRGCVAASAGRVPGQCDMAGSFALAGVDLVATTSTPSMLSNNLSSHACRSNSGGVTKEVLAYASGTEFHFIARDEGSGGAWVEGTRGASSASSPRPNDPSPGSSTVLQDLAQSVSLFSAHGRSFLAACFEDGLTVRIFELLESGASSTLQASATFTFTPNSSDPVIVRATRDAEDDANAASTFTRGAVVCTTLNGDPVLCIGTSTGFVMLFHCKEVGGNCRFTFWKSLAPEAPSGGDAGVGDIAWAPVIALAAPDAEGSEGSALASTLVVGYEDASLRVFRIDGQATHCIWRSLNISLSLRRSSDGSEGETIVAVGVVPSLNVIIAATLSGAVIYFGVSDPGEDAVHGETLSLQMKVAVRAHAGWLGAMAVDQARRMVATCANDGTLHVLRVVGLSNIGNDDSTLRDLALFSAHRPKTSFTGVAFLGSGSGTAPSVAAAAYEKDEVVVFDLK